MNEQFNKLSAEWDAMADDRARDAAIARDVMGLIETNLLHNLNEEMKMAKQ